MRHLLLLAGLYLPGTAVGSFDPGFCHGPIDPACFTVEVLDPLPISLGSHLMLPVRVSYHGTCTAWTVYTRSSPLSQFQIVVEDGPAGVAPGKRYRPEIVEQKKGKLRDENPASFTPFKYSLAAPPKGQSHILAFVGDNRNAVELRELYEYNLRKHEESVNPHQEFVLSSNLWRHHEMGLFDFIQGERIYYVPVSEFVEFQEPGVYTIKVRLLAPLDVNATHLPHDLDEYDSIDSEWVRIIVLHESESSRLQQSEGVSQPVHFGLRYYDGELGRMRFPSGHFNSLSMDVLGLREPLGRPKEVTPTEDGFPFSIHIFGDVVQCEAARDEYVEIWRNAAKGLIVDGGFVDYPEMVHGFRRRMDEFASNVQAPGTWEE